MSASPPHSAGDALVWLGFAVFMAGWVVVSLRTGAVFLHFRTITRAASPAGFWFACAVKLVFAALGVWAAVISGGGQ